VGGGSPHQGRDTSQGTVAHGGAHIGAGEMKKKEQKKETSMHQPQAASPKG